jgi:hypothetical protein
MIVRPKGYPDPFSKTQNSNPEHSGVNFVWYLNLSGSVVASRLSEISHWRVLLIEAGGPEPTGTQVPSMFLNFLGSDIDWGYRTEPEEQACLGEVERRCYWPRGKVPWLLIHWSHSIIDFAFIIHLPSFFCTFLYLRLFLFISWLHIAFYSMGPDGVFTGVGPPEA